MYTLPQKKRNFSESTFPGDPGSGSVTQGYKEFLNGIFCEMLPRTLPKWKFTITTTDYSHLQKKCNLQKKLHIFWGRVYVCENVPFPFSLIHSLTNYMYRSFWGHICTGGYGSHTGSFLTQKSSLMNRFQIWHCRDSVSFCIFQLKTFDDKVDLCTQKWASSVASVGWIRRQLSRVTWFL